MLHKAIAEIGLNPGDYELTMSGSRDAIPTGENLALVDLRQLAQLQRSRRPKGK